MNGHPAVGTRAVPVARTVTAVPGALLWAVWWGQRDVPLEGQSGDAPGLAAWGSTHHQLSPGGERLDVGAVVVLVHLAQDGSHAGHVVTLRREQLGQALPWPVLRGPCEPTQAPPAIPTPRPHSLPLQTSPCAPLSPGSLVPLSPLSAHPAPRVGQPCQLPWCCRECGHNHNVFVVA